MYESQIEVNITREEARYAPDNQVGKWVLKRWSWRQKMNAVKNSTEVIDAKRKITSSDVALFEAHMLLTCMKSAPEGFVINMESIDQLDVDVGDKLIKACRDLNGMTQEEQTNLSDATAEGKDTKP